MTNATNIIIEDLRFVEVPASWKGFWLFWLILLAAGIIAFLLMRHYSKSRAPRQVPSLASSKPPPHLDALRRLDHLREAYLRAEVDSYFLAIQCSQILRDYVEARFALPIPYQTTREFLDCVESSSSIDSQARARLGEFLRFFDRLKFARAFATQEEG